MCELTDEQIEAMTPQQRRELIIRLERRMSDLVDPSMAARVRRARLGFMVGGSLALIPWIVFLAVTLPDRYVAANWPVTWVGFDALLVTLMLDTAYLGSHRRALVVLTAFATAVMLVCDAWFDITTAGPDDRWLSVCVAIFAELPLAILLILGTLRLMKTMGSRLWLLTPGMSSTEYRMMRSMGIVLRGRSTTAAKTANFRFVGQPGTAG